jgi:hypothetical protein
VKSKPLRQLIKCLSAVLAAGAFAAPVAQAHHAPAEDRSASVRPASAWIASGREIDRLGPKYVPLQHPYFAAPDEGSRPGATATRSATANARHDAMPVSVTNVVRPSGFDWGDAGIGAGVSSLTLALVAGLALLLVRRSQRKSVPERSELAGT